MGIYEWENDDYSVSDKLSEHGEFSYMNSAVEAMCDSLINEPHLWLFGVHTFHKKGSSIEYWSARTDCIRETWNGHTCEKVFSVEQGYKIKKAYDIARKKQASKTQKKVIDQFKPKEDTVSKKWWEIWK